MTPRFIVSLRLFRRLQTGRVIAPWAALFVIAMIGAASATGERNDLTALSNTGVTVPSTANIYGAGHSVAPNEGDVPPGISFPAVTGQTVTFPSVTGIVRFDQPHDDFGNGSASPDGGAFLAPTDVSATGGLSEIKMPNTEGLLGVFLSDAEPADPAPAALDFGPNGLTENFDSISPKLGQVFFIGNGRTANGKLQTFFAPAGATRLFLGVADSYDGESIIGPPGHYGDNGGQYNVQVQVGAPVAPAHGGLSATNFTVNESSSPAYPPAAAPVNGLTDTVLRFAARQTGAAANQSLRVQATTTPNVEGSWTDLPNASNGRMVFDVTTNQFVLSSNDYPYQQADPVYFRAVTSAGGYADSVSNVVGPFNLTSNKPRTSSTRLLFTGNGPIADFYFKAIESATPAGIAVRVQATITPADEATWTDLNNGHGGVMTQSSDPNQFLLLVNKLPATVGIYFRAVASAPGFVDSISNLIGPFDLTAVTPPDVAVQLQGGLATSGDGLGPNSPFVIPAGTFTVTATAQTSRSIKKLALLVDGLIKFAVNDGSKSLQYTLGGLPIGDHVLEAVAVDDLGSRARAGTGATYIRVVPALSALKARGAASSISRAVSIGKTYVVLHSGGNWDDPATWVDGNGSPGIPGPDDFVIIGSASVKFGIERTAKSLSLNGGHLLGPGIVTITGIMTLSAGTIEDNVGIIISSGAVMELNNPTDIQFNAGSSGKGHIFNAGTCNIHGSAGVIGADNITNDGTINWLPALQIPLNADVDPDAGLRQLQATSFVNGGVISGDLSHLIGSDSAGIISDNSEGLVAAGGGNIVGSNSAGLIAAGGGNIVGSNSAGIVGSNSAGVVSAGGGNLIAAGGGNFRASVAAPSDSAPAGFTQSGGESNLSAFNIFGPVTLNGGTLSGSGFIQGNLTNNAGYISPGHSAGVIGVLGNFSQGANGSLIIDKGGSSARQLDQIQVRGAANLGGKLDVKLINGYTPDPADTSSPLGYSSVSGSFASISSNLQLTVTANGLLASINPNVPGPKPGQPLNIATRMSVQTGDNVLIAGFIVTGPNGSTKKVLIRGLGPSLAQFGVPNPLADPLLELHTSDGTVTNDNWQQGDTSQIPNGFAPSDPHEAVIVATLTPGNYSAVVKGAHGETGVGIAELYDLDSASPAQLANISTRGLINTGDDVMIGGFIVGGAEPAKILVRAVGPTLSDFGVQGALQDPTLELHDSNGASISNDDWRETQEADIIATTIPPNKNQEPAILATLAPGNYTAVVRGKNNTTGIGLVEAYNLQ